MLNINTKHAALSKTTMFIIFLSLFLNNTRPNFGLEVSPISLLLLLIVFVLNHRRCCSDYKIRFLISLFIFSFLNTIFFITAMDLIKDSVFFLILIVGFMLGNQPVQNVRLIRYFTIFLFIFALFQLIPEYSQFHKVIFVRSSMSEGRGLTSILGEPSFLAACTSIMLLNYCILKEKIELTDPIIIVLIVTLLSSFSAMAFFGMVLILWKSNVSVMAKTTFLFLMIFLLWPIISGFNIRIVHVLFNIIQGNPLDQSASSRLFYIYKDLQIAVDSLLFPLWGIGGYTHASGNMMNIELPKDFLYNPELSGSLLGRYIVSFGFLLFVVLLLFIHKSSKKKFIDMLLYLGFICLLMIQMIPTGLVTFNLFLGSSLASLYNLSRYHNYPNGRL